MKKTLLLFVFMITGLAVNAQQTPPKKTTYPDSAAKLDPPLVITHSDSLKIFTSVQKEPSFPGGMQKLYEYIQNNLRYPDAARKNNVQGKVFLGFVVEHDGSLSDIKIYRGISDECDAEAVRVLTASPKWIPGMQNGHTVRVAYIVPVNFKL